LTADSDRTGRSLPGVRPADDGRLFRMTRVVHIVLTTLGALLLSGSAVARPPSHIVPLDEGPKVTGSLVVSVAGRLQFFADPQNDTPDRRLQGRLPALDLWLGGLATTRTRFVIGGLVEGSVSDALDNLSLFLALGGVAEPRPDLQLRVLGEIGPTFYIQAGAARSTSGGDGRSGVFPGGIKMSLSAHVMHVFPGRRHAIGVRIYLTQRPVGGFFRGLWALGVGFVWEPGLHPPPRFRPPLAKQPW
jgi:hypothetical protein